MNDAKKANQEYYDHLASKKEFIKSSPHLKHKSLQTMYLSYVDDCVTKVKSKHQSAYMPLVLDLGAGDGTATISFLAKGCKVTAVDISQTQLDRFSEHYPQYSPQCEMVCQDALEFIRKAKAEIDAQQRPPFDIIVFNSFIHHIPDYFELLTEAAGILSSRGIIFIFQDPIFYPSLPKSHRDFAKATYLIWRITQGDMLGGIKRRLQRNKGDFSSPESDVEYHVVREGVNQKEILALLKKIGFGSMYFSYFTTYFTLFQWLGTTMKMKSHFAIISQKVS